ncbi:MAG TPA: hypothetical protein VHW92_08585 [Mycobacteriales bacterium]|jgi:hypothetical protein|nr:hypothetical protein [Mycobacteriales bacterium]
MSVIRSVPSQVDANGIDELIADARQIALPRQVTVDLTRAEQPESLVIPPASVNLVEGYDDYGV